MVPFSMVQSGSGRTAQQAVLMALRCREARLSRVAVGDGDSRLPLTAGRRGGTAGRRSAHGARNIQTRLVAKLLVSGASKGSTGLQAGRALGFSDGCGC